MRTFQLYILNGNCGGSLQGGLASGEVALRSMAFLNQYKIESFARTESEFSCVEYLSLKDMQEIFG